MAARRLIVGITHTYNSPGSLAEDVGYIIVNLHWDDIIIGQEGHVQLVGSASANLYPITTNWSHDHSATVSCTLRVTLGSEHPNKINSWFRTLVLMVEN